MMKYEIFKDVVENAVLDYLPPEYQNSELHLKRVKKVNGMDYDGLVVRKEDTNVCPVINMTQLYEDYKLSEDIELVIKNAADIVLMAYDVAPVNEYQDVLDEGFRQNIIYEISNAKANAQRLAGCPTRQLNDLTVSYNIYCIALKGLYEIKQITENWKENGKFSRDRLKISNKDWFDFIQNKRYL